MNRLDAQRRLVHAIRKELATPNGPKLSSFQLFAIGARDHLTVDECRYYDTQMVGTIEARAFLFGVFSLCGTPDRAAACLYEDDAPWRRSARILAQEW